ncbi:MAG: hypothetical protein WAP55_02390 [Minisyncoccia bacterium]
MAARKKNSDDFDEMAARANALMEKTKSEGEESNASARNFRKFVMAYLTLQMKMIVWLYQYVRANQAAQKELDDEAVLEGSIAFLEQANSAGTKMIDVHDGKASAASPADNGSPARAVVLGVAVARDSDGASREAVAAASRR